jgi:hypothetical protein
MDNVVFVAAGVVAHAEGISMANPRTTASLATRLQKIVAKADPT